MSLHIRRAGRADLAALVMLERSFPGDRLTRRGFRHLLTRAHADVWVAADGAELLGNAVVLYRTHTTSARLYSLVVAPVARGRGIARALVQAAEAAATARRVRRMFLEVRCDNAAAIRLYQKLGYRLMGQLPGFYEDGADGWRLENLLPIDGAPAGPRKLAA